jgi:hypothetical protein
MGLGKWCPGVASNKFVWSKGQIKMKSPDHFSLGAKHFAGLFGEIQNVSDRVAGITAAAFVDDTLARTIAAHFVELDKKLQQRIFEGPNSALGTFSAKIAIGYALGLYGPITCGDLDIIRSIRNDFAHTAAPLSFNHPPIRSKCEHLKSISPNRRRTPPTPMPKNDSARGIDILVGAMVNTPKSLFLGAALHITFGLGMSTRSSNSRRRPSEKKRYLP